MNVDRLALSLTIPQAARQLGFADCRILPVTAASHADFFDAWIAQGRAGEMTYLERHADKRRHPRLLHEAGQPELHSLLVLAVNYHQFDLPPAVRDDPSRGIIAAYAWGDDYHELIRPRLYELDAFIRAQTGRTTPGKCLVDTGPVLERDWAEQAGLGFIGKNCCTIDPQAGSWLLLATLLVPEELVYTSPPQAVHRPTITVDEIMTGLPGDQNYGSWSIPLQADPAQSKIQNPKSKIATCGRCTRCLAACPTAAFVGPYHLDPQRCIAYWTIEASQPIPRALRPHFGNRIFGCDICQEVCPWNRHLPTQTPRLAGLHTQSERVAPPLLEGFAPDNPYWLDQAAFSSRFRRSPIKRAKRQGMLRNVCVALGNWADVDAVEALAQALRDPATIVRGHAAWALGEILRRQRHLPARQLLMDAQVDESDVWVLEEIAAALA